MTAPMPKLPVLVFVYGSLKRTHWNSHHFEDSEFVCKALTVDRFKMLNSGFPVLTPSPDGLRVVGEVYKVSRERVMKSLDRLEGEGRMYDRKEIEVVGDDGEAVYVQVYIGCEHFAESLLRRSHGDGAAIWTNADGHLEWRVQAENILTENELDELDLPAPWRQEN